ncbi:MAG: alpha/beta hydrolase family protein [Polyangiaceae bacterium]|jgi:pimeloyl-ACP methyl ester carboxylesterase
MNRSRPAAWFAATAFWLLARSSAAATLSPHTEVTGPGAAVAEVRPDKGTWRRIPWDDLERTSLEPGAYVLRVRLEAGRPGEGLQVPPCAGRRRVRIDGGDAVAPPGPLVVPLSPGMHELVLEIEVSPYERRIACGERPRVGPTSSTREGLGVLAFDSPFGPRGGGHAVVYVPPGHDEHRPSALLVGAHPWNGTIWTYAAYAGLLREARARDLVLLMPSGLGNSLYTADAESEVTRAIGALAEVLAIDRHRVSIWGASMGGAGATTMGLHHPDRFASVVSFFGDSKYDVTTYVRSILPDDRAAHRVNALDVVDNARNLPVWLVHGENDRTSPIRQSELLAAAMSERGFDVRFDRAPGEGHSGALVARFLPEVVAKAATAVVRGDVARVTYRSVRDEDLGAYGVRIVRASVHDDAFVDVERREDGVHVRRADGIREVWLARGALGTSLDHPPPILVDGAGTAVRVGWEAPP